MNETVLPTELPQLEKARSSRNSSLVLATTTILACMASAAYVTARSRVFVAVFAGMRIDLPDMTRWAIVTPVSYFSILLLVLALILAIKEFVLPNKRLKFRLNILGIFLMAAIIVAWIEAIITPFMSILWTVSKE